MCTNVQIGLSKYKVNDITCEKGSWQKTKTNTRAFTVGLMAIVDDIFAFLITINFPVFRAVYGVLPPILGNKILKNSRPKQFRFKEIIIQSKFYITPFGCWPNHRLCESHQLENKSDASPS